MVAICSTICLGKASAQCNVKSQPLGSGSGLSAYYTKYEELQTEAKAGEFTNWYSIRLSLTYTANTKEAKFYAIDVAYGLLELGVDIPPRSLIFRFTDGTTTTVKADNEQKSGTGRTDYMYFLTDLDAQQLKSKSLASLELVDYRENLRVTCKPYSAMFSEALECINKSLRSKY